MFKIQNVIIDPPLILAPVAGHTDSTFRQIIKELGGCGLVVSELASTEALTRRQGRTSYITRFDQKEHPVSIQLFGSDPGRMAESAVMVQDMGADIIDINCGCPVKKVVRQKGGSFLLRDLPLLEKILRAVRKAATIPLTVKIRSGWDHQSINATEVLRLAEDCGVDALAIHGRTRSELFSGRADWKIIAKIKEAAHIPIIGNGDVFSPQDAERMIRETGVDGVMIGRGVLSNPWLIRQCWDHLNGRPVQMVSFEQKRDFMMAFLKRIHREMPPPVALGKMKKVGGYLTKGLPGGAHLRAEIHESDTAEALLQAMERLLAGMRLE